MTIKRNEATWIVVANQELARIYERAAKLDGLDEVKRLEHPEGARAGRELVSDRPGRSFDSAGQGRHGMEPPTDPKEQEAIRFAKEVGREIEDGRVHHRFGSLVLVAGPEFLGRLRQEISEQTRRMIEREIGKNLYEFDSVEIREMVANAT